MNVSGIYCIQNKLNNKKYIGQSINVGKRLREHKRSINNPLVNHRPLYKDMKKYGIENFSFEIIEQCCIEDLNEREFFWIKETDSFNKNSGYNLTPGGDSNYLSRIISDEEVQYVIELLRNGTELKDINELTSLSYSFIQSVNNGELFKEKNQVYPIKRTKLTQTEVREICHLLEKDTLSIKKISEIYRVNTNSISGINTGSYHHQSEINYPIRELELNNAQIEEIIKKLKDDNIKQIEIADAFGVSSTTISNINTGKSYPQSKLKYPIRESFLSQANVLEIEKLLKETDISQEDISKRYNKTRFAIMRVNQGKNDFSSPNLKFPIRERSKYLNILIENKDGEVFAFDSLQEAAEILFKNGIIKSEKEVIRNGLNLSLSEKRVYKGFFVYEVGRKPSKEFIKESFVRYTSRFGKVVLEDKNKDEFIFNTLRDASVWLIENNFTKAKIKSIQSNLSKVVNGHKRSYLNFKVRRV